MIEIRL